jgi:hypothetical protein
MDQDKMRDKFLEKILGTTGFNAMEKALSMTKVGNALFVRTLYSWLNVLPKNGFEGYIPGTEMPLFLVKNNESFSGKMMVKSLPYAFENKSIDFIAALISVALGEDGKLDSGPYGLDKLGKSIDTLVKTEIVKSSLAKRDPRISPAGPPAQPKGFTPPSQPQPIQEEASIKKQEKKLSKKSKIFKLKKTDLVAKCSACDEPLFLKEQFNGCYCYDKDGVELIQKNDVIMLKFNAKIESNDILELLEEIRNYG